LLSYMIVVNAFWKKALQDAVFQVF
jgi:hypothetical protein